MANATRNRTRIPAAVQIAAVAAGVLVPPALGFALAGHPAVSWPGFPPRPPTLPMPGFSAAVFTGYLIAIGAVLAPFLSRLLRTERPALPPPAARFPLWGWAGVAVLVAAWGLAWWDAAPPALRRHAFTPLWLGYIVAVQGWLQRRTGTCRLTAEPLRFLALFPASAVFWWTFEYLNGFVGNWIYTGGSELSGWAYLLTSTLPFTTVLPAVVGTRDALATIPALQGGLERFWEPPRPPRTAGGITALAAGTVLLGLLPVFPVALHAGVWIAPLLLVTGVQTLAGDRHVLRPLARGDWRALWLGALAGLACGFLWELWNWASLARWHYRLPYVEAGYIFEMPLPGYAGYLPFGVLCLAAAHLLTRRGLEGFD